LWWSPWNCNKWNDAMKSWFDFWMFNYVFTCKLWITCSSALTGGTIKSTTVELKLSKLSACTGSSHIGHWLWTIKYFYVNYYFE
jgi:hypothetical protein